jgi:hypothetical protein
VEIVGYRDVRGLQKVVLRLGTWLLDYFARPRSDEIGPNSETGLALPN